MLSCKKGQSDPWRLQPLGDVKNAHTRRVCANTHLSLFRHPFLVLKNRQIFFLAFITSSSGARSTVCMISDMSPAATCANDRPSCLLLVLDKRLLVDVESSSSSDAPHSVFILKSVISIVANRQTCCSLCVLPFMMISILKQVL